MEDVKTFKSFTEIVGQEKAITFLKRVMAREKIPHAYLFTGIPGVGKTTSALALTQAINCHEQIDGEGCGQCKSCQQVMHGNFPDLIYIRPGGQSIKSDSCLFSKNPLSIISTVLPRLPSDILASTRTFSSSIPSFSISHSAMTRTGKGLNEIF